MSNFFEELKKRNVYKVATAYAVTAWLLMQVAGTLANNLGWPSSIANFITRILIVGFPIAVVLTWLFEFTPKGFKRTGKTQQDTSDNQKAGRRLNRVIIGTLALALCFMLVERLFFAGRTSINEKQKASIAVLPFDFQSSDNSLAFMSEALSGAISDRLGKVSGLTVTAKTSSSQFKEGGDVREIGEDLDVNYLMEGDLHLEDNRLRLSTRLINASNGYVIWQNQYDQEFDRIIEIEEAISRKVVKELRVELFPEESSRLGKKISENSEAYKLYLEGLETGKLKTEESLQKAIKLMEEALVLEPNFAEVHAALVTLYLDRNLFGEFPRDQMLENVVIHLEKAEEINATAPEVLVASAKLDRDSSSAITKYRRAISMNPGFSEAYNELAGLLFNTPYKDLAIRTRIKAYELDPYNDYLASIVAQTYKYYIPEDHPLWDDKKPMAILNKVLKRNPSANWCSRIKATFLAASPNGNLANSFITHHKAMQEDKYEAIHMNYASSYLVSLDLIPIAEHYTNLHQAKYPNNIYSFWMRYQINQFKRNHRSNLDLVEVQAEKLGLSPTEISGIQIENYWLLGNNKKVKELIRKTTPNMAEAINSLTDTTNLPFDTKQYELDLYAKLLVAEGEQEKSSILASKLCDYYKQIPKESLENPLEKYGRTADCYYYRNDIDSLVYTLNKFWFDEKARLIFDPFYAYKAGYYRPFEEDSTFLAFFNKVEKETHRMRAEVIEYLKKEGDWDPAWDKELGLE